MEQQANPYQAPAAALGATETPDVTYPARFLSFKGRIDRMRYLGYCSLAYLLNCAIMIVLSLAQEKFFPQLNNSEAAYVIFFITTGLVAPLTLHAIYARRRLQDLGKSGWLTVPAAIPVVGYLFAFYLALTPGAPEPNEFGPGAKSGKSVVLWTFAIVPGLLLCLIVNAALVSSIYAGYQMRQLEVENPVLQPRH